MSDFPSKQTLTILGSTGSIGANTLKVIDEHPEKFSVFALTANTKSDALYQQCLKYRPQVAVMADKGSAQKLRNKLALTPFEIEVLDGLSGLEAVASAEEVDTVMAAIVGGVGLMPTLAAALAGKKILLANKEALVMAGGLFLSAVKQNGARLLPIDSEHNAIFQCLPVNHQGQFNHDEQQGFKKIVLTASGGPFLNTPLKAMDTITPEQACIHPNWEMGPKISVDSATLLNKALELIEASLLFDTSEKLIDIVVHPQSIVHSMVYYTDGSVLAQMGNPDMKTPIAYGLAWPNRIDLDVESLELTKMSSLDFFAPDEDKFPCLKLGRQAAKTQGSAPIILNAANEIAVAAFLAGRLRFTQIPVIIEAALNQQKTVKVDSIAGVLLEDKKARNLSQKLIEKFTLERALN